MSAADFVAAQGKNERFGFWARVYCGYPETCTKNAERLWDSVTTRAVLEKLHASLVSGEIHDPLETGSVGTVVAFGQLHMDDDESATLTVRYDNSRGARIDRVFLNRRLGKWSVDSAQTVAWADRADSLAPR